MKEQEGTEGGFEKQWREAMDNGGIAPPSAVWSEIDRKLAYADLATYKSKSTYYKWLAAAILLLAGSLSVFQLIYFQLRDQNLISKSIEITYPQLQDVPDIEMMMMSDNQSSNASSNSSGIRKWSPTTTNLPLIKHTAHNKPTKGLSDNIMLALGSNDETDQSLLISRSDDFLTIEKKNVAILASLNPDLDIQLFKRAVYHFEKTTRKTKADKYWAGLDVGSGSFDPNFQSGSNGLVAQNLDFSPNAFSLSSNELLDSQSPSVVEEMNAGETISLGINFGLKLGNKWSIQSGIQYARSDATTQTNVVIQSSQIQEALPVTGQAKQVQQYVGVLKEESVLSYEYRDISLKNQFQFTSIPVTAGYRLLDRRFKIDVNAGVVTNFYMGNRIEGVSNDIAELSIGPGAESPYRSVSFSGLAGVEFGYQLLKNFDLIIEPNYRQGINGLTKDASNFSTSPSGFGVLTGLRYNFN